MSIYLKICTGLIVSLLSLGAQADDNNLQTRDQPPATESLDVKNTTEVIQALYVSSLTQMKVADLVREKSPDESLRDYADKLTRDHRWINRSLDWLANIKSVSLEPEDLGESAQLVNTQTNSELQTLAQTSPDEFRSAFITASIRSHQETLQFYNRIDQNNTDDALKVLIRVFRQVEEMHLVNAQKLQ
ncbi:MAG TPA: DUF4142 domain-containing protein [Oligoflexus sp.]|uniref:DUF4142 domain-containing protein n=1 Tax=Oligoflexus sp. TaxID=1971216 RepID=UPI002D6F9DB1|nr:DUF4142 domain-containing protein [Oligoflexus sp.]HYX33468.1 DUF4142 domain-containing protein [Oligoflexus sp.]